jgi:germination protein YpeB
MKGRKDSDVNIDISRNGGMVIYMLDARNVGQPKLNVSDASKIGVKFLEKNGYKDMIPTFAMRYDETAVINFVSVRKKVVIYPDQIKLKIALDNGDIIGIEAMHYLTAHYDRKIPSPRINTSEARKNVSQKISIKNIRLTIIPMESMREVLCYEFYGTYNNERYMVYINAIDGTEERILKIMDTENGELSM